jgi:uncharacterized membrane protein
MVWLILGLLLFLGAHSVRIVADGWRSRTLERVGEKAWKGGYTLISLLGLGLIVWGFAQARQQPLPLWPVPPAGLRHLAGVLMWVAFVLLAAAYVPGNHLRPRLGHPMLLSVKVWALAHLLANHTLADALLFGGFLLWAVACYRAARARDRAAGLVPAPGTWGATLATLAVGTLLWAGFGFWAHGAWLGVRPFGV